MDIVAGCTVLMEDTIALIKEYYYEQVYVTGYG